MLKLLQTRRKEIDFDISFQAQVIEEALFRSPNTPGGFDKNI